MIHETFPIQVEGSLPDTRLVTYIQEDSDAMEIDKRPIVLICPGGGYRYTSDREAEPIAMSFLAMGYHAAVLRYSCAPAKYPTALTELAKAMLLIHEHAAEWHVDEDKVIVQGSSAGGHLAACLGVFWDEDGLSERLGLSKEQQYLLRPDGMLLSYPVITSGEYAHRGSFENLCGVEENELWKKLSLENQVTGKTPPTFLWGTFEDQSVPMENSLLLVSALRRAGVPVEYHLYPKGVHGLALANRLTKTADGRALQKECTTWVELAHTWMESNFC